MQDTLLKEAAIREKDLSKANNITDSEFVTNLKRTEPHQIVFELEKLHGEAKSLDIAVQYVTQVKKNYEEELQILEEELNRCQKYMEETENIGIMKYNHADVSHWNLQSEPNKYSKLV